MVNKSFIMIPITWKGIFNDNKLLDESTLLKK